MLWLTVAALLFAFFAKTDNAPLGGIYDWMYIHVPGWKLFREGSKFLYIVTLAYAILIPIALSSVFQWTAAHLSELRARMLRAGAAAALVGVVALSAWSVVILQTGTLGSTTQSTPEPAALTAFSRILAADSRPGPVLWFGQPLIGNNLHNHHFLIASPTHPAVNLTGKFGGSRTNQRDPFQLYCPDNVIAFCYVDQKLFPYLVQMAGAGYVVVPGGQGAGSLPAGITRGWLQQQMSSMFGNPMVLGSGSTSLWVWRMSSPQPAVTTGPAIAEIEFRHVGHHRGTAGADSPGHTRGISRELRQQPVSRRSAQPSRRHRGDAARQQHLHRQRCGRGRGDGGEHWHLDTGHGRRHTAHTVVAQRSGSAALTRLECLRTRSAHHRCQHHHQRCGSSDHRTLPELVIADRHGSRRPSKRRQRDHPHRLQRADHGLDRLGQRHVG